MIYAIAGIFVIILDQWLKYFVDGHIVYNEGSMQLIPGIVRLVNVHNDGAAFGFLAGGNATIYFIIIAGVFTVAVILAIATKLISSPFGRWCAAIVAAAGLSNCIDRVICTYVQDMICLEFMDFPVFNLADIFITVFCILFIIDLIFGGERGLGRHRDEDEDEEEEEEEEIEDDEEEETPARASRPLFGRRAAASVEEEDADEAPVSRSGPARATAQERAAASQPPKETRKTRQAKYASDYEQLKAARAARMQQQPAAGSGSPVIRSAPAIDPNDPFAEWERANAEMNARKEAEKLAATRKFEAPAPEATRKFEPVTEVKPAPAAEPFTFEILDADRPAPAPAKHAYEAPAAVNVPVQQSAPASASGGTGDLDLDAILAEFQ